MSVQEKSSPAEIISNFWNAPDDALFDQKALAVVLGLSKKWFERCRWQGNGIVFLKLSKSVRYRKGDVLEWLKQQKSGQSTTQVQMEVSHGA